MSSGPFTYSLGVAAAFVMRSLMERSHLQTADEIAGAPEARGEVDAEGADEGLRELASHGLAEQGSDGRWSLTDTGREAAGREDQRGA
jgi:hypothetical protein